MEKIVVFLLIVFTPVFALPQDANYDESKVPDFKLPELMRLKNGRKVKNAINWMKDRRPEILADFENEMYGIIPGVLEISGTQVLEEDKNVFSGKATRRQVRLFFSSGHKKVKIDVLLYIPNLSKPVPVFLGLNFSGNQAVCNDPDILITDSWVINNESLGITDHRATEQSRGGKAHRWQVEKLIEEGFALATTCCGDIDPDRDDFTDGVHPFLCREGQEKPAPEEWGTIAAWAWGLSRILDYLENLDNIDSEKVIVLGHSRLGKTALWAGASDNRFAAVISNNSGCGGAALSRRAFGETVERINRSFPHWFCDNFVKYGNNESALPVDQHMLIALIAPRPVYITSASEDQWADPKGEYLSGFYASEVYKLFGFEGLKSPEQPPANTPVIKRVSYHIREGKHDITGYDWDQYIRFAKLYVLN